MVRKVSPQPADLLADKLLRVLQAQRVLGPESYPLTAGRLLELTDPEASPALAKQALGKKNLFQKAIVRVSTSLDAPLALAEDLDLLAASPRTLDFLLRAAAKPATRAFTPAGLTAKGVSEKMKKPIKEALARQIAEETLPTTVGWVSIRGRPNLFLLTDLHSAWSGGRKSPESDSGDLRPPLRARTLPAPSADAAPLADFAAAFDVAFARLDREAGGWNFVSLVGLRRALPVPRAAFDAGLEQLRRQGRYALSAAEGRQGISPEERDAAIPEEGSLLLFVSRNTP
jgi:hypothetical protein